MIDLKFDDFARQAQGLGGRINQVPYALSLALNETVKDARLKIINETWPKAVTVRNKTFMRAALQTRFASKTNLRVEIYDSLKRGSLSLHASGGVKKARGGALAVPARSVPRTGKGVPDRLRPRNLSRKVVKNGLIFQAVGRGKNARLRLMYRLVSSATIKKDVPFYNDFARYMAEGARVRFPAAMARAMRTAR